MVGTGHPELIDREKLLGNWDCYYKCDLISVKFESEDKNHTYFQQGKFNTNNY